MYLDKRSASILNLLCKKSKLTDVELMESFQLTRRMLDYCINKINDYLSSHNLSEVCISSPGIYTLDSAAGRAVLAEHAASVHKGYIPGEEERCQLIILIILSRTEDITLQHLMLYLEVSKNTVLKDLKQVKQLLSEAGLMLDYSRSQGYYIEGTEEDKRLLLLELTQSVLNSPPGISILKKVCQVSDTELLFFRSQLETLEAATGITYTDENLHHAAIAAVFIRRRIGSGKSLEKGVLPYQELAATREFRYLSKVAASESVLPEEELYFITLQLISSPIARMSALGDQLSRQLEDAITQLIKTFESTTCIYMKNTEQLQQQLLQHMRPMYYRIKYQVHLPRYIDQAIGSDELDSEFQYVHYFIRKSIAPVEQCFGGCIPDEEVMGISLLFTSWVTRNQVSAVSKRAVIVCTSGISVSELLFGVLSELLPEITFLTPMSLRDFAVFPEHQYDLVFSSTYLQTSKILFLIRPFMTRIEKMHLREQVMRTVFQVSGLYINIGEIEAIIDRHADIRNRKGLRQELNKYLLLDTSESTAAENRPGLSDLLKPEYIQLDHPARSWGEAIRTASAPLLQNGYIEEAYILEMIKLYEEEQNRIPWGTAITVPHAGCDQGVRKTGMSMLRLMNPLRCQGAQDVRLIVILSAADKKQHLRAILQLLSLAGQEADLERIIQESSTDKIHRILQKYSQTA